MFSMNDKISLRQLQVLLITDIFGTGVIILPKKAALLAGRDGWIAVLLASIFACLCVFLITQLAKQFPGKSFFEYASDLVSAPVAYLLSLGLIVRIIIMLACQVRFFGEIVKDMLLYNTPLWIVSLCMLLISAYAACKGYETRARIAQILIWLIFLPVIFVFSISVKDLDFGALLPVFQSSPESLLNGGFHTLFAFSGIEFLLLVSPYVNTHKDITSKCVSAIAIAGTAMVVITFITMCRFGPLNIQNLDWPVLEMMYTVDLPGSFIERQEALVMSFWIMSVFLSVNAGLFFSSLVIKSAVKKRKHSYYLLMVTGIVFVISLFMKDMEMVYKLMDSVFLYFGITYMLIVPALLLLIANAKKIFKNGANMKTTKVLSVFLVLIMLSGCTDNRELEGRAVVISLGVDKAESGEYEISLEIPEIASSEIKGAGKTVKTETGETITQAVYETQGYSNRSIYMGHTKLAVISEDVLKDNKWLRQLTDVMLEDKDISRKIIILACEGEGGGGDKASKILETETEDGSTVGVYISDFYKKTEERNNYVMDLDKMTKDMTENDFAVIPKIKREDEKLKFDGAAVIKDFEYAGSLGAESLRGFLWIKEKNEGDKIVFEVDNKPAVINVSGQKTDMEFFQDESGLCVNINIKINGETEEISKEEEKKPGYAEKIKRSASEAIESDIQLAYEYFYNEWGIDGFGFKRELQKKDTDLYGVYIENMGIGIEDIKANVDVQVL
ncbi:MAG: endospore germination permease [Clostridiales bacterium]|jgi:spore germination protein|nr:endospore germination permease [Clostridiales bacterium]